VCIRERERERERETERGAGGEVVQAARRERRDYAGGFEAYMASLRPYVWETWMLLVTNVVLVLNPSFEYFCRSTSRHHRSRGRWNRTPKSGRVTRRTREGTTPRPLSRAQGHCAAVAGMIIITIITIIILNKP
jgi:hypothetical protein